MTASDAIYMGLDFGMKSIGSAVGDTLTQTAQMLQAISAAQGEPDWQLLDKLVHTWKPDGFVVGLPLNMDGTEQGITQHAKQFFKALEARYQKPCYWSEEQLTTVAAKEALFEEGGYRELSKAKIDCMSAKLILEQWLRLR